MRPYPFRPALPLLTLTVVLACTPKTSRAALPQTDEDGGAPAQKSQEREGTALDADGIPGKPGTAARANVKPDISADEALAKAETLVSPQTPRPRAAEAFLAVRRAHPGTTAGQEALYRAGVLYYEAGDYASARKVLTELLFENPGFSKAQDARYRWGQAAYQLGAYRDAYLTLSSSAEVASAGEERTRFLDAAGRAAEAALLTGPALKIAVKLNAEAQAVPGGSTAADAEKSRRTQKVTDLIDSKASLYDVAGALEGLPATDPSWPWLTFKLARVYYHLRDWQKLEQTLGLFLRQAPSHPLATDAQALLARANRRAKLSPRTLGLILPMSGRYKPIGDAIMRGVKLAFEKSDIQLVVKDSQGDASTAGRAVEELTYDHGAIAIIGPVLADDARRAAVVAEDVQVPILTLTKTEGITQVGPHVFRNMLTNTAQAQALAEYGTKVMGFKNFGVLYPNSPNGVELRDQFWDALLQRGANMRGAESYSSGQTTFTEEAKKLVGRYFMEDRLEYVEKSREVAQTEKDPFRRRKAMEKVRSGLTPVVDFDALFIPDEWSRVGLIAPALAVEDIITNACDPKDLERIKKTTGRKDLKTLMLLGTNLWSSRKGRSGLPELLERGGKFVTCSMYVDGFYADSTRAPTKKFVKLYKDAYGDSSSSDPGLLEAIGYDSAGIARYIIEQKAPGNRADFREALAHLRDFNGATGKTSISADREAVKPLFLLAIGAKGIEEVEAGTKLDEALTN